MCHAIATLDGGEPRENHAVIVGAMNDPSRPLEDELARIAASGFGLADVTLEPPRAWPCDGARLGSQLANLGLPAVGHTAYYLPIASPLTPLRDAAHDLFRRALDVFAAAGIERVNVHPDPLNRLFSPDERRARNADAIAELAAEAKARNLTLMVENLGTPFGFVEDLRPLFASAPDLRFHLDVGHANLGRGSFGPNRTQELLAAFGDRLAHVHLSDNLGLEDLHLPLGAGSINWPAVVAALKEARWDGTVTLEIFSRERRHLETSRDLWLKWWHEAG
jgi:sugar phosphate isomerase/epimerase